MTYSYKGASYSETNEQMSSALATKQGKWKALRMARKDATFAERPTCFPTMLKVKANCDDIGQNERARAAPSE